MTVWQVSFCLNYINYTWMFHDLRCFFFFFLMLLTAQMWPKTKAKTKMPASLDFLPDKKWSFINYITAKLYLEAPDILLLCFLLGYKSSSLLYFLLYLLYTNFCTFVFLLIHSKGYDKNTQDMYF